MVPHGVAYQEFKAASENAPPPMQISKGTIALMFESSRPFTITDYAWNSEKLHQHDPKMWDELVGRLIPRWLGEASPPLTIAFVQTTFPSIPSRWKGCWRNRNPRLADPSGYDTGTAASYFIANEPRIPVTDPTHL